MIWVDGKPVYTTSGATVEELWVNGEPTAFHEYIALAGGGVGTLLSGLLAGKLQKRLIS